jgi:hypothetical protein
MVMKEMMMIIVKVEVLLQMDFMLTNSQVTI